MRHSAAFEKARLEFLKSLIFNKSKLIEAAFS